MTTFLYNMIVPLDAIGSHGRIRFIDGKYHAQVAPANTDGAAPYEEEFQTDYNDYDEFLAVFDTPERAAAYLDSINKVAPA